MRSNKPIFLLAPSAAGVLVLASASAVGYSHNVSPGGDPVRWLEPRVTVVLDGSLSRLGDVDDIRDIVEDTFAIWTDAVAFPFEVEVVDGECGAKVDGVSCVLAEGAPPPDDDDAGAKTYVQYHASNGAIADADVVFYESAGPWAEGGEEGALDVSAVASHEIGHLFGLGHSDVAEARMYPTILTGDDWEGVLDEDDIAGAEALYEGVELGGEPGAMSCAASVAPGRPGATSSFLAMLLVLGLSCLRKARRQPAAR